MEEKILNIIEEISGTDEIKRNRDINLFDKGLLDSLGMIELFVALEEVLGVTIEPTEIEREEINTPNKIINYVFRKVNQ